MRSSLCSAALLLLIIASAHHHGASAATADGPAPAPSPAAAPVPAAAGAAAAGPAAHSSYYDVCVVGAGPSGVTATVGLRERGKSVLVIDKRMQVGGQTSPTYTDPRGFTVRMGAYWFNPWDYPLAMQYARATGLGALEPMQGLTDNSVKILFDNVALQPDLVMPDPPPLEKQPEFIEAYKKFKAVVDSYQAAIEAPGLAATMRLAPELAMPAREFLRSKNLSTLAPLLEAELTVLGEVPVAYALRFMTPSNLLRIVSMLGYDASGLTGHGKNGTFADNIYVFPGNAGFAELLRRTLETANLPKGALQLGATITSVRRPPVGSDAPVALGFTDSAGNPHAASCGVLVSTAAPTVSGLSWLGLDAEETAVFSSVEARQVATVATSFDPPLPYGIYFFAGNLTREQAAEFMASGGGGLGGGAPAAEQEQSPLAQMLGGMGSFGGGSVDGSGAVRFDGSPLMGYMRALRAAAATAPRNAGAASPSPSGAAAAPAPISAAAIRNLQPNVVVSFTSSTTPLDAAGYRRKAEETYAGGIYTGKRKPQVKDVQVYDYFPHVQTAALRSGWAERAEAIQGRRKTYYAGGAFSFWNVEHAMRSGRDLVDRYWPRSEGGSSAATAAA